MLRVFWLIVCSYWYLIIYSTINYGKKKKTTSFITGGKLRFYLLNKSLALSSKPSPADLAALATFCKSSRPSFPSSPRRPLTTSFFLTSAAIRSKSSFVNFPSSPKIPFNTSLFAAKVFNFFRASFFNSSTTFVAVLVY